MHFILALLAFLPLVYCDSIKVNSPTRSQVFKNSSFLVDYLIERNNNNNGLFLTNTTTQLLDINDNVLVAFPKDLASSPSVRLNMMTYVKENTVTNFTLKIIGFGKYNTSFNGKSSDEIETKIPLQLNLSSDDKVTSNTTSTATSTATSTSTNTVTATNTANSTATGNKTSSTSASTSASASTSSTPSQSSDANKSIHFTMLYALTIGILFFM
jgi:cobalamin biosynthesis Mg chelatase CobN